MLMDIKAIMKCLPHRYPFLLVDRVLELTPYKGIRCIKNVTANEEFFQGHFPGEPIMPGVLLVEAMAQAGGILAIRSMDACDAMVYFMSIERAKFRKMVVPGDQLVIEAEVIKDRGRIWKMAGTCKVDGAVVTEVEFTAMLTAAEKEA